MLLSICIPTHEGRAGTLGALLEGLVPQIAAAEGVELCIGDNASQDGTRALVESARERLGGRLRYVRHPVNLGSTANVLACIDAATGEWCWMIGSDDLVAGDAVAEVVALVRRHPGAAGGTLHRSAILASDPGTPIAEARALLPSHPDTERELVSEREIAAEVGHLQDFISTQVVRRDLWRAVVADLGPGGLERGRSYPHLLIIGLMVRRRPRWFWYPRALVHQRIGATAFFEEVEGVAPPAGESAYDAARYELELLVQRRRIWTYLHGARSPLYRAMMRRIWLRHHSHAVLLSVKLNPRTRPRSEWRLLGAGLRSFWWYDRFWLLSMPLHLAPGAAWRALQRLAEGLRGARARLSAGGG